MSIKIGIMILQFFIVSIASSNSVNFQDEKNFLQTKLSCDQEQFYPETDVAGSKWHCSDLSEEQRMEITKKLGSEESIASIKLLFFSNVDEDVSSKFAELYHSVIEKFAGINSGEALDVLKNCSSPRQFIERYEISVSCLIGPVKVERYLRIKILPSA